MARRAWRGDGRLMPRRRVEPLPASDAGPGLDVSTVGAIVAADYHGEADLIAVLRRAQAEYGHLPEPVVREIARLTGILESRVFSAITFYAFLAERRQGKFIVRLCRTISCDLQGKDRVARRLENELGIGFGETTGDGMFTLEWTNCLCMCDQGPALLVNDRVLTRVHAESVPGIIAECRHVAAAPARRSEGGASRVTTSARAPRRSPPSRPRLDSRRRSRCRARTSPQCSPRRASRAAVGPAFSPAPSGTSRSPSKAMRSTSSATQTRANRARSRTGSSSASPPISSSRA